MTIKTASVKISRRFYDDRSERGLDVPAILRATRAHYFIDVLSPYIDDFFNDAEYYSDIVSMSGDASYIGLQSSARATVRAIRSAA